MGSTAENSPLRLAANNPTSRSARDSGTPCEISPARHSASGRVTRVTVCPVSSDAISAMSARSRDCQPVSGGVIPLRLPSSVSAITAAAARSACEVQETLPSAGATSLPVSGALPGNDSFSEGHEGTRGKIVSAAIRLLNHGGRDAVTTRAVAEAAGVQAPTIYRLFGDKGRLLDAVAEYGFAAYLGRKKIRKPSPDPVENLRAGWDLHVDFGLSNPALYALMYCDPKPGASSPAAAASYVVLREHIRSIAAAGRLRLSEERAANLVHASGCGTVLTLLAMPENRRDLAISAIARESILAAITTESPMTHRLSAASAAVALAALLPKSSSLSGAERQLLDEWLKRIADESG